MIINNAHIYFMLMHLSDVAADKGSSILAHASTSGPFGMETSLQHKILFHMVKSMILPAALYGCETTYGVK
jgi:hypothetical protein